MREATAKVFILARCMVMGEIMGKAKDLKSDTRMMVMRNKLEVHRAWSAL
jgi:hypothetical protein